MNGQPSPIFPRERVFGPFSFDETSGRLTKRGVRLRLQGQPLQILAAPIRQPGKVVSREELQQQLWNNGTFVNFDHSLNAAMNRLRSVLGDSADRPRYIETLPSRGYYFVAPVQDANPRPVANTAVPNGATVEKTAKETTGPRRSGYGRWAFAAFTVVGVVVAYLAAARSFTT